MVSVRPLSVVPGISTRIHALVFIPPEGVLTEFMVMVAGSCNGFENICAASHMNKIIVLFVYDERFGHDIASLWLTTESSHFIFVSPT